MAARLQDNQVSQRLDVLVQFIQVMVREDCIAEIQFILASVYSLTAILGSICNFFLAQEINVLYCRDTGPVGHTVGVLPFLPNILKSAGNSVGMDYPAPSKHGLKLYEGFPVSGQMH